MDIKINNTANEINAEGANSPVSSVESKIDTTTPPIHIVENKGGTGVYNHNFKTPFEYQGQKYQTICFRFNKLTGQDFVAIENEMMNNNEYALDPLLSRIFLSKLASRASGIPNDVINAMPARDFKKITDETRNFFTDTE